MMIAPADILAVKLMNLELVIELSQSSKYIAGEYVADMFKKSPVSMLTVELKA